MKLTCKDFFELQEKIVKNSLIISLIHSKFYNNKEITLGYTVSPVEPTLIPYITKNGKTPKRVMYSIIATSDDTAIHIWLKYKDIATIHKMDFKILEISIKEIAQKVYEAFKIHPAKLDTIFSLPNIPVDFVLYVSQDTKVTLWTCGFNRKYETKREIKQPLDETKIENYYKFLETVYLKYKTIAKILIHIAKYGYYTCENLSEKFSFILKGTTILANYQDFQLCKNTTCDIALEDFAPKNLYTFTIPVAHLMYIV